ncbi:hypothetical protein KCU92_g297, partial [Aureobasidium melanogenum]
MLNFFAAINPRAAVDAVGDVASRQVETEACSTRAGSAPIQNCTNIEMICILGSNPVSSISSLSAAMLCSLVVLSSRSLDECVANPTVPSLPLSVCTEMPVVSPFQGTPAKA